jgi:hypothetical protein
MWYRRITTRFCQLTKYVRTLIEGASGSRRRMQQIGELGGSARSAAKAKSSHENGRRGGRPKDKEAA